MFSLNIFVFLLFIIALWDRHSNSNQLPEAQHCNNNVKRRLLTSARDETYPDFQGQGLHLESFKHDKTELHKSILNEHFQFPLAFERNTSNVNKSPSSSKRNTSSISKRSGSTNDNEISKFTFQGKAREDAFRVTPPEKHPYSVLVMIFIPSDQDAYCTGSLITNRWVLTAAHCITRTHKISHLVIYAGGNSIKEYINNTFPSSAQILTSNEYYGHPKYVRGVSNYDMAVVKVNGTFRMTKYVKTITMATVPWKFKGYARCVFTGFGVVQLEEPNVYDNMRKTHNFEVKTPCRCASKIKAIRGQSNVEGFLCAKSREDYGICYGDSGGGLICDGLLWGVCMEIVMIVDQSSCSVSDVESVKCGLKTTISVFGSTCPYLSWINQHVKLFKKSQIPKGCMKPKNKSVITKPTLLCVLLSCIINMLFYNM